MVDESGPQPEDDLSVSVALKDDVLRGLVVDASKSLREDVSPSRRATWGTAPKQSVARSPSAAVLMGA
ncbi:Uncharacterised protein [Amycolatopsis camponoti]|uniref:Uncharacterized protein n=1 Tax=Amycolatopsis camponoti TaxID=2606593 RepID=A0A6I8M1A6_9PSEU|nr:hypothetical protein [Amycolatopsis camponoti]VVJ21736.1 Uncharacterised protein [Amycolatopsis camponoti]